MENILQKVFSAYMRYLADHPEAVTDKTEESLNRMYADLCKVCGLSEHSAWGVKWKIEKRQASGAPILETVTGNVILNGGANEMLKLIFGIKPSTPYDSANARIVVGSDDTAENASQKGVLAIGMNRAEAAIDSGYPKVEPGSRTGVIRATFGESVANFAWNEISLMNGQGGGAIALNRKQAKMGTKNGGVWTVQLEVSVVVVN